jgi:hypothetical protein
MQETQLSELPSATPRIRKLQRRLLPSQPKPPRFPALTRVSIAQCRLESQLHRCIDTASFAWQDPKSTTNAGAIDCSRERRKYKVQIRTARIEHLRERPKTDQDQLNSSFGDSAPSILHSLIDLIGANLPFSEDRFCGWLKNQQLKYAREWCKSQLSNTGGRYRGYRRSDWVFSAGGMPLKY